METNPFTLICLGDTTCYQHYVILLSFSYPWAANITKILIKHGAKVNAETRISKFTPLHKAVQQNWEDIIEILIQNGARTDVEDLLLGKTLSELMDNAFKNDLEKAYGNSCKCCD